MEAPLLVYQILNFTRQEVLFGITPLSLEQELERLIKNPPEPMREWKRGDVVSWRGLTGLMDPGAARLLHQQLQLKSPPNKFKVLKVAE